jgi:hypothetical protein
VDKRTSDAASPSATTPRCLTPPTSNSTARSC